MVHTLAAITLLLYAASSTLLLIGLYSSSRWHHSRWQRYGTLACRGGFVLLTIFVLATLTQERVFSTAGDYFLWVAWAMEAGYEFLKLEFPIVRVFVSSITLLIFASSSWLVHHELSHSPQPDPFLLLSHVIPALLAQVCLLLAFIISAVFLMQQRRIKQKSVEFLSERAPSLSKLEGLNRKLILGGFFCMTIAVISGSLRAAGLGIPVKITQDVTNWSALAAWGLLALLLHGLTTMGWSSRKVSVVTLVGVSLVVVGSVMGMMITGQMLHGR